VEYFSNLIPEIVDGNALYDKIYTISGVNTENKRMEDIKNINDQNEENELNEANLDRDRETLEKALLAKLPPSLKKEMLAIRKSETLILEKLNNDAELAKLFMTDPGKALTKIGVSLSPGLKKRLKPGDRPSHYSQPQEIRLPDGQTVTPRIKIRFTGKKEVTGKNDK
jgi:hypothetical protein